MLHTTPLAHNGAAKVSYIANVIAYGKDGDVDWDETMRKFCEAFDFDMSLVAVTEKCADDLDEFDCQSRYHTVGKYGQMASSKCSDCRAVSHDRSLTHYSVSKKCIAISNDFDKDPRCAMQEVNEELGVKSVICLPLLLPNGTPVGLLGAGCRENKRWHGTELIEKVMCTVDYLALKLQVWKMKLRERVMRMEMQDVIKRTITEISEANRSRDTFIATMSHEIRTPLTSIVAMIQLLLNTKVCEENTEKIRRLYDVAQSSSGQLLELINDILDFCKLRSTKLNLAEEEIDLFSVVNETLEMFGSQAKQKHVELRNQFTCAANSHVIGDSKRIKQVILNLLSNALKFTDADGYINVKVSFEDHNDDKMTALFKVEVQDNGIGISADTMAHIFEPYFTSKRKDWTDVLNGVGLGLAISRELVDLMGGKIYLQSDGMRGTRATIEIPMRRSLRLNYMQLAAGEETFSIPPHEPIIVLDDRLEHRLYMMKMARRWNMVPHSFCSSSEALMALDVLGSNSFRLALVDIDLNLSEENDTGVVFAQSIRSRGYNMKLIAVSSVGVNFGGHQLFDVVLVKPVGELQLYESTKRCLKEFSTPQTIVRRKSVATTDGHERHEGHEGHEGHERHGHHHNTSATNELLDTSLGILIVDDDVENASIFAEIFKDHLGFEKVEYVTSASECLYRLAQRKDWDIVFMDIVMPNTDGVECVRRIRSNVDRYGAPKVIAITADALDSTKFKCLNSGFDFFLSKPTTIKDFQNAVRWVTTKRNSSM